MLASTIGDNVGMVGTHLDIAPGGWARALVHVQCSDEDRIIRVGDIDERHLFGHAHKCIVSAGLRVGPAPDVVGGHPTATTHIPHR